MNFDEMTRRGAERTARLLEEIADEARTRLQAAEAYAQAIRSPECICVKWDSLNKAIIARWGEKSLDQMKHVIWQGRLWPKK